MMVGTAVASTMLSVSALSGARVGGRSETGPGSAKLLSSRRNSHPVKTKTKARMASKYVAFENLCNIVYFLRKNS